MPAREQAAGAAAADRAADTTTDAARAGDDDAYARARRRADEKLAFVRELLAYLVTVLVVTLVAGRFVAGIVAFWWGLGVLKHAFAVFAAPRLRERWIEQEVQQRVSRDVRREREVLAAEHTRSLEELAASIAHDIRNPIAAARSLVQQMGEDPNSAENVEFARVALEELARVERSVSHLLRYARDEALRPAPMRLTEPLEASLETLRERITRLGVRVERRFDTDGQMEGDAQQLRRVFGNLVGNALDAMEHAGTTDPALVVTTGSSLAGSEVWASIRDNGPGLDAETSARVFEPFFTSKADGTGLGLAVTRKLVERHGGTIEVHSLPGRGAEFVLTFPRQGVAASA